MQKIHVALMHILFPWTCKVHIFSGNGGLPDILDKIINQDQKKDFHPGLMHLESNHCDNACLHSTKRS